MIFSPKVPVQVNKYNTKDPIRVFLYNNLSQDDLIYCDNNKQRITHNERYYKLSNRTTRTSIN